MKLKKSFGNLEADRLAKDGSLKARDYHSVKKNEDWKKIAMKTGAAKKRSARAEAFSKLCTIFFRPTFILSCTPLRSLTLFISRYSNLVFRNHLPKFKSITFLQCPNSFICFLKNHVHH